MELRESEHPARKIIDEYKTRKREKIVALLDGAPDMREPDRLADEFFLLFEGARISIQCCAVRPLDACRRNDARPARTRAARRQAETLIFSKSFWTCRG